MLGIQNKKSWLRDQSEQSCTFGVVQVKFTYLICQVCVLQKYQTGFTDVVLAVVLSMVEILFGFGPDNP